MGATGATGSSGIVSYTAYVANQNAPFRINVIDTSAGVVTQNAIDRSTATIIYPMALATNGTFVYVANAGGGVSVISTKTNGVVAQLSTGTSPRNLAMSPDGQYLYVGDQNYGSGGAVYVVDTSNNTVVGSVSDPSSYIKGPNAIAFAPSGQLVLVANQNHGGSGGTVAVISTTGVGGLRAPTILGTLGNTSSDAFKTPSGIAFNVTGQTAYVTSKDGNGVTMINVDDRVVSGDIAGFNAPVGIVVKGQSLYVANSGTNTVSVVNLATQNNPVITATITVMSGPQSLALTPDGKYLYVAGSNTVKVINTATNTVTATITDPDNYTVGDGYGLVVV
jgi:YVTN family beta-propeller protein